MGLKTPSDLAKLSKELLKITVEASLNAEMEARLGYGKHSPEGYNTGNGRNGHNRKTLKGDHGELETATPRDRNGGFEAIFVAKNQIRLGLMTGLIIDEFTVMLMKISVI